MALLYFFFWLVCTHEHQISVAGSCLTSSSDVIAQNDRWDPTTRSSQSWLYTFTVLRPRLRPHKAMSPQYWFDQTVCVCVCVFVCLFVSSRQSVLTTLVSYLLRHLGPVSTLLGNWGLLFIRIDQEKL